MPDGVDASVNRMQATGRERSIDERPVDAERKYLRARDDSVLADGDPGQHHPRWSGFASHIEANPLHLDHGGRFPPGLQRI